MPELHTQSSPGGSRPEIELLLCCARTQITPEISHPIKSRFKMALTDELIQLAMRQEIMPLLYRNLQQVCPDSVPEHLLGALQTRYDRRAAEARRRAEDSRESCHF